MKLVPYFALLFALTACMAPTYKHGVYDGRKKIGFKAKYQDGMYYYLCEPGPNSKETWDRGARAHAYAEAKRKEYFDTYFNPMLDSLKNPEVLKSLELRAELREFDDKVVIEMEKRFQCAFYQPPGQNRDQ